MYLNSSDYVVYEMMPNRVIHFIVTNHQTQDMDKLLKIEASELKLLS